MTTRKQINETLRNYRRLKEENPDLLNEDINAIIVAASNEAVAQAIFSLGSSVETREGPITIHEVSRDEVFRDEERREMLQSVQDLIRGTE